MSLFPGRRVLASGGPFSGPRRARECLELTAPCSHSLGHECMGIVESVGPSVKNLKVGDRVVSGFNIAW